MANYRQNDEKMYTDITDGIAIIINSETGIYYGMNSFATEVYENLAKGISDEKIWEKIKSFGADEENFKMFLNSLLDKELIIVGEGNDNVPEISEKTAKEDNLILELKEYNDAQELLLADPIHDVKEDKGWSPEKDSLNTDKDDVLRREAKMEK